MIATIHYNSRKLKIDFSKPLDLSIPLRATEDNLNAWRHAPPKIAPAEDGKWVAAVAKGAAVNYNNIEFNPHAHCTHTECVGHITEKVYSVNKHLNQFFFLAEVITVAPESHSEDFIISKKQIQFALGNKKREALIVRTLPNTRKGKFSKQYSDTNWPYIHVDAVAYLVDKGIKHLLIDTPSIDKERDGGELVGHNTFWDTNGKLRLDATITEFIYVSNKISDGEYFLNLQIAPFENDASPSKPILYKVEE